MKTIVMNVVSLALACVSLLAQFASQPVQAAIWNTPGGGDWNVPGNWDTVDVPDTSTETANFTIVNGGPYYMTLNDTMYPGGLTTGNLQLNPAHPNIGLTRFYQLDAEGSGGTLDWTFGDLANPGSLFVQRSQLNLTNANLNFLGTPGGDTIRMNQLAPNHL